MSMYRSAYQQYPTISQQPQQQQQQPRSTVAYSSSTPGVRSSSGLVGQPQSFLRHNSGSFGFGNNGNNPLQSQSSSSLHHHHPQHHPHILSPSPNANANAQAAGTGASASATTTTAATTTNGGQINDQQLDLNDFPALGASQPQTQLPVATNNMANPSSYAAQAQASTANHSHASNHSAVSRDFTNPEDFPALGGQSTAVDSHSHGHGHGPGINGYQSQNLQSILAQNNAIQRNNGLLQPEDKRLYGLKPNPQTPSSWSQQPSAYNQPATNGVSQRQQQYAQQQQQVAQQQPQDATPPLDATSTTAQQQLVQPHTPADQVLHSAADRWGLLALVRALRAQTDDALSSGQDLGLLGMELDNPGSLYPKFATPWADYATAAPATEPNYHLPSCYNVAPPPPSAKKAAQFSDETLFFTFYAMPRDVFQDLAAQELYNRNWRYHKTLRLWITQDVTVPPPSSVSGSGPSGQDPSRPSQTPAADGGQWCTVWDVEAWERQPRMIRLDLSQLESREPNVANANGPTSNSATATGTVPGGVATTGAGGVNSMIGDRPNATTPSAGQALGQMGLSQQQQQQQLRA